jgi:hypothetical protein
MRTGQHGLRLADARSTSLRTNCDSFDWSERINTERAACGDPVNDRLAVFHSRRHVARRDPAADAVLLEERDDAERGVPDPGWRS